MKSILLFLIWKFELVHAELHSIGERASVDNNVGQLAPESEIVLSLFNG